jgi:hypothetical protein
MHIEFSFATILYRNKHEKIYDSYRSFLYILKGLIYPAHKM